MDPALFLITIGVLFLFALALDSLGRIVHVPRVTLLILLGAVLGPPGLDLLPEVIASGDETFSAVALTMVAFLLGGSLEKKALASRGREILFISVFVVLVSVVMVGGVLILLGAPVAVSLALAGISAATAPAATQDVVRQSGRTGRFASNLLGIVAIDDAWGLLAFSLLLMLAGHLVGGDGAASVVLHGLWEAGGGILLGLAIGLPAAYLTGRLKPGEPSLLEALSIVLICSGLSLYLEVSYLLSGMVAGAIVVNFARHHQYPFHEIERIEWPFILIFFIMAGSLLELHLLGVFGWVGLAYILARFISRVAGAWLGARLSGISGREGRLMGLALTPQAGVAIGMALVAAERFPAHAEQIIAVTIASTIVFELVGPLFTQFALNRVPEEP